MKSSLLISTMLFVVFALSQEAAAQSDQCKDVRTGGAG